MTTAMKLLIVTSANIGASARLSYWMKRMKRKLH
jgi:hypothetical protein